MEFVGSKFNAETDTDRPSMDEIIEKDGKKFKIGKIEAQEAKDVMKLALSGKDPDKCGFDDVLYKQHSTRPFVVWVIYVNEINL